MTDKAIVAHIKYAGQEFEGLMLPDGTYAISFTQVRTLLELPVRQDNLVRDLKALLPKDFPFVKASTELNSRKIWILTLDQFSVLLALLAHKNTKALQFILASTTEKLERIFDNAFGQIVDERERELRFAARMSSKATFKPLMDELKKHGFTADHPDTKYRYQYYIWRFQTALGIKSGTRDEISADQLMDIVSAQSTLKGMIMAGTPPLDALIGWETDITN